MSRKQQNYFTIIVCLIKYNYFLLLFSLLLYYTNYFIYFLSTYPNISIVIYCEPVRAYCLSVLLQFCNIIIPPSYFSSEQKRFEHSARWMQEISSSRLRMNLCKYVPVFTWLIFKRRWYAVTPILQLWRNRWELGIYSRDGNRYSIGNTEYSTGLKNIWLRFWQYFIGTFLMVIVTSLCSENL